MKKNYLLYNGKINLVFDEDTHTYTVNNEVVYGITSIISVLSKPGLIYWAANIGAQTFLDSVKAGDVLDEIKIKEIADKIRTAHSFAKNKSADVGTMLHKWIENFLSAGLKKEKLPPKPVNKEMRNAVDAFLDWAKKNKVKFLETERKVYSIKHKYAGTCDAVAVVNGKYAVVDFKTTNSIYPEMWLQTAAYNKALEEETGQKFDLNLVVRLSKEDKQKGINSFEVLETENIEENFKTFLACLQIYRWQMENKKREILSRLK